MSPNITYIVIINFVHAFEIEIDANISDLEEEVIIRAIRKFNEKEMRDKEIFRENGRDHEVEKIWDIRLVIKEQQ